MESVLIVDVSIEWTKPKYSQPAHNKLKQAALEVLVETKRGLKNRSFKKKCSLGESGRVTYRTQLSNHHTVIFILLKSGTKKAQARVRESWNAPVWSRLLPRKVTRLVYLPPFLRDNTRHGIFEETGKYRRPRRAIVF
ncbi:hypothetical protein NDU88_001770 [Pleurodeles waltl]|uniref:Uncharacterized protein n=1 Tax=Pleurodeles waltl TaxID=8319 RepID=A0AAV7RC64_PLEWA|nr:hypothetical protein NDU88_001770 [Pleurodeles waltl]